MYGIKVEENQKRKKITCKMRHERYLIWLLSKTNPGIPLVACSVLRRPSTPTGSGFECGRAQHCLKAGVP